MPEVNIDFDILEEGNLPFGFSTLDETYLKGAKKGTTIAVIGSTETDVSMFLTQTTSVNPAKYVITDKPREIVEEESYITSHDDPRKRAIPEDLTIKDYSDMRTQEDSLTLKEYIRRITTQREQEELLIVDNFSTVHNQTNKDTFIELSKEIYRNTNETGGITYLYFPKKGYESLSDAEKSVVGICDSVFRFELVESNEDISSVLKIPRFRGKQIERNRYPLNTGDYISIEETMGIQ